MTTSAALGLMVAAIVLRVASAALGQEACWINWKVNRTTASGITEMNLCDADEVVKIINVAIFYALFYFVVRVLVLATQ
eukprot:CAMPEP_0117531156 /NCGR_PEP_ID=MMETSP0784-20121206/38715_1 /TAXON_ID=39447 /ORGANISM="" /LENGTH=78 /DNA_ID=CAMNT_0005327525 /DNA_START=114 /DNA_END=350 /DNA_ORIENTATION=+